MKRATREKVCVGVGGEKSREKPLRSRLSLWAEYTLHLLTCTVSGENVDAPNTSTRKPSFQRPRDWPHTQGRVKVTAAPPHPMPYVTQTMRSVSAVVTAPCHLLKSLREAWGPSGRESSFLGHPPGGDSVAIIWASLSWPDCCVPALGD